VKKAHPDLDLLLLVTLQKHLTNQYLSNWRNCPPHPYRVYEGPHNLHMELSLAAK
jgi:hypothetical protein